VPILVLFAVRMLHRPQRTRPIAAATRLQEAPR